MFERFTERARQVVVVAQSEAQRAGMEIGPEHVLIGLYLDEAGLAHRVLNNLVLGDAITTLRPKGKRKPQSGQIPFTASAKRSMELALREALSLGHNYIGTEHLLLGLIRQEDDNLALDFLRIQLGDDAVKQVRDEVIRLLMGDTKPEPQPEAVEEEDMDDRLEEIAQAFKRGVSQGRRELTLDEYQGQAHSTAVYPSEVALVYCATKLAGEAGEVSEKIGKWLRDRTLEFVWDDASGQVTLIQADPDVDVRDALCKELGDVLWYVAEFAGVLGFELSEIGQANLDKLASRAERGVLKGSGDDR